MKEKRRWRSISKGRSANRIVSVIKNTFRKKIFLMSIIFFMIFLTVFSISGTQKTSESINAANYCESCTTYHNQTYYFGIHAYSSNCGKPLSGLKGHVRLSPDLLIKNQSLSGKRTITINFTTNSSGYANISFKSDKYWCCHVSFNNLGSTGGTLSPINGNISNNNISYQSVYDGNNTNIGFLLLVNNVYNYKPTSYYEYRLVESDNVTLNLGLLGGFEHRVISIPVPTKEQLKNNHASGPLLSSSELTARCVVTGELEKKVNGTWTTSSLHSTQYPIYFYSYPSVTIITDNLGIQFSGQFSLILVIFCSIISTVAFGFQKTNGEIEFANSMPIKKWQIFLGKYISLLFVTGIFTLTVLLSSYLTNTILNSFFTNNSGIAQVFIPILLLGMFGVSLSFFITSISKSLIKIISLPIVITLFTYYVYDRLVSSFLVYYSEVLNFEFFNPFEYYRIFFSYQGSPVHSLCLPDNQKVIVSIIFWIVIFSVGGVIIWSKKE